MKESLRVVSIGNCGILVRTANTAVLIDGIFEETAHFEGLSDGEFEKMMGQAAPYGQIDYLLFTHGHRDHLDLGRLVRYLETHHISGLFIPEEAGSFRSDLSALIEKRRIPLVEPEFGATGKRIWPMGDMTLAYFFSAHSGKQYGNVNHYGLLIEAAGRRLYFSGDSDFMSDREVENLAGTDVDLAFYNPFYLHTETGRGIIAGINAKSNYIYHIPPERKDEFQIRRQAIRDIDIYRDALPQTGLLLEPNMEITMRPGH